MRKTIVLLPILCFCLWTLQSFAITGTNMYRWEMDTVHANLVENAHSFDDVLGNDFDAENCSVASLSRLLFGNEKVDAYQYKTIKEFAKTIITVSKENGITTCQFSIPYDDNVETQRMLSYTISPDKTYAFVVQDKNDATEILWSLAQWLMNEKQIDFLFEHGAEDFLTEYAMPDNEWKNTESTLCKYIYLGRISVVKKLLDNGASVNDFCYARISQKTFIESYIANPITLAITRNNIDIVKLLLEYGAIIAQNGSLSNNETNDVIQTNPLVEAARNYDILSLLLKQKDVNVNQYAVFGPMQISPLFMALATGDAKTIDLLISSGANINNVSIFNQKAKINGLWALLEGARSMRQHGDDVNGRQDKEIIEKLIKAGADYNAAFEGHTPLSFVKLYAKDLIDVFQKYNAKEDVEIVEHNFCTSEYGSRRICGKVINNTDEDKSITISFNFYDKDGYRIGNDSTHINNLEPGSVWKFDNVFPEDDTVNYKIVDIKTGLF